VWWTCLWRIATPTLRCGIPFSSHTSNPLPVVFPLPLPVAFPLPVVFPSHSSLLCGGVRGTPLPTCSFVVVFSSHSPAVLCGTGAVLHYYCCLWGSSPTIWGFPSHTSAVVCVWYLGCTSSLLLSLVVFVSHSLWCSPPTPHSFAVVCVVCSCAASPLLLRGVLHPLPCGVVWYSCCAASLLLLRGVLLSLSVVLCGTFSVLHHYSSPHSL
jgi:hypothetical protein